MFGSVDFEAESVADGLRRHGVHFDVPTLFSWLGVTMYLTEPAIDAVLETVASLPSPSGIAFTFAQPRSPADDASGGPSLADLAAASGEPWVTYFGPEALERKLRALRFRTTRFLTPPEAYARYFQGRLDGLPAPRRTTIVSAAV